MRLNAVALEWLTSPVVYRRDVGAAAELTALARTATYLPALLSGGAAPVAIEANIEAMREQLLRRSI